MPCIAIDTTLSALKSSQNERLWFKTNMKLAKLWFDKHEFHRLQRILRELHGSCTTEGGQDDQKKGTQLLELYSLEIQMHTEKKDNKKLRALVLGEEATCRQLVDALLARSAALKDAASAVASEATKH